METEDYGPQSSPQLMSIYDCAVHKFSTMTYFPEHSFVSATEESEEEKEQVTEPTVPQEEEPKEQELKEPEQKDEQSKDLIPREPERKDELIKYQIPRETEQKAEEELKTLMEKGIRSDPVIVNSDEKQSTTIPIVEHNNINEGTRGLDATFAKRVRSTKQKPDQELKPRKRERLLEKSSISWSKKNISMSLQNKAPSKQPKEAKKTTEPQFRTEIPALEKKVGSQWAKIPKNTQTADQFIKSVEEFMGQKSELCDVPDPDFDFLTS